MANIGPWLGVPANQQRVCAVVGCNSEGKGQVCIYDGRYHHHGCIHYECDAASVTGHGLVFRKGAWALLCGAHYAVLLDAWTKHDAKVRAESAARGIT